MYSTSNGIYGNWDRHKSPEKNQYRNLTQVNIKKNPIINQHQPGNYYPQQYQAKQQNPEYLGLFNLGNTCYMNSVLQALFDVLTVTCTSSYNQPITFLYSQLQKTHDTRDYSEFKRYLGGRLQFVAGLQEQDAHQLLTGLLEILNRQNQQTIGGKPNLQIDMTKSINHNWRQYIEQMKKTDNSKIIDLFGGQLYTQLRCPRNHGQYLFQRFLNVSIPITSQNNQIFHLQRLLTDNFKQQTLDGVTCEKCNLKTKKNKKSVIYNPPRILVIHLKRFQQGYWSNYKINSPIAFNQMLQLKNDYIHPDTLALNPKYDLHAVVHHIGTMNKGHYFTQKKVGSNWLTFNDTKVTPSPMKAVENISDTAYILFYKRR